MPSPEELFNSNMGLVNAMIYRKFYKHRQDDDVKQAGLIGLWKASTKFESSRGINFSSFACKCIFNQICNGLLRQETRYNNFFKTGTKSFDEVYDSRLAYTHENFEHIELKDLFKNLSNEEFDILTEIIINKNNQKYLAEKYKKHSSSISQTYMRSIRKITQEYKNINKGIYKTVLKPSEQHGEKHSSAKLDWDKVKEIREKHKNGINYNKLASEYNVSPTAIKCVIKNKTWKEKV